MEKDKVKGISYEKGYETALRMAPVTELKSSIRTAGTQSVKAHGGLPPQFEFERQGGMYYDPGSYSIHVGTDDIIDIFAPRDEEDFLDALDYAVRHEEGHLKYTAQIPYAHAIERAGQVVIENIAERLGIRKNFRSESEYTVFCSIYLREKGLYLNYRLLNALFAGIANSIEDGREERKQAAVNSHFRLQRTKYRGRFWLTQSSRDYDPDEYADDPGRRLSLMTEQILLLSTCQKYGRNFSSAFAGTAVFDEVHGAMPYIAKGVLSETTRGMAEQVILLAEYMSPLIFDALVCAYDDYAATGDVWEQILDNVIRTIGECGCEVRRGDLSEKEEDQSEAGGGSALLLPDLVITLPDDVYDRLVKEKEEEKGGASGGLMIKREHPRNEAEEEKELKESSGSDTGAASDAPPEKSGDAESFPDDPGSKESEPASSAFSKSDSEDEDSGDAIKDSAPDSNENGTSGDLTGDSDSSGEKKGKSADELKADSDTKKQIEEEVRRASARTREEAKRDLEALSKHLQRERREAAAKKTVPDRSGPVTEESVRDLLDGISFSELKRGYRLTDDLPAVLKSRARSQKKKFQEYLRSRSLPNISNLDSGLIDPSRICGLAYGDTEVFRKNGTQSRFDGCVYMLIDNSGSMHGQKRSLACRAAAVQEEAFKELIPIKIVAFDERGELIHDVVKGWDEVTAKNACWNFCLHGRSGSGNEDGYDILIASRELMQRPEEKKLLIILSDGAPGDQGLVRRAVKEARKKGITVASIYFEEEMDDEDDPAMKFMYEYDYICCSAEEIDMHLSKIVKKFSRS